MSGIHLIRLPPRSPNLNAFAERFVRSIKSECLNRNDLLRTGLASARDHPLHGALPRRTQSSGPRKPTSAARPYRRTISVGASAPTSRWNPQLLSPRSCVNCVDSVSGQHALGTRPLPKSKLDSLWGCGKVARGAPSATLLTQAGEDTDATRASRIGKLMTAAAAARAISAYHIH